MLSFNFVILPAILLLLQPVNPQTYVVFTMGGDGSYGFNDGMGTLSKFHDPVELVVDSEKNVFVADRNNNRIRKITKSGNVTTLAGNSQSGRDDGPLSSSTVNMPNGIAMDVDGGLLIADKNNNVIRKIKDGRISTVFGTAGATTSKDGQGTNANFHELAGLDVSKKGEIVACEFTFHQVRYINSSGYVSTVARNLNGVRKGVFDNKGNIYLTVDSSHVILKMDINNGFAISHVAGNVNSGSYADGIGTQARFNRPISIYQDRDDSIYIADLENNSIRKINPSTFEVTTFAGVKNELFTTDGLLQKSRFSRPHGVTVDFEGDIYVADWTSHTIRKIMYCPLNADCSDMSGYTCPVGYGKNSTSRTCDKCRDDQLYPTPESRMPCIDCPVGARCDKDVSVCLPGYFRTSSSIIQNMCSPCPVGTFKSSFNNSAICNQCEIGSESNSDKSACKPCADGKYRPFLANLTCINCPNNAVCTTTSFQCLPGYEVNSSGDGCIACPNGFLKTETGNELCQCPIGMESNENRDTCLSCPSGKFKPSFDYKTCVDCPVGAKCTTSALTCLAGYEPSLNFTFQCQQCSEPYFKPAMGNEACVPCPSGSFPSDDYSSCLPCAMGEYLLPNGTCTPCGIGQEPDPLRTKCEPCAPGYFKPLHSKICVICPNGAECDVTTFTCKPGYQISHTKTGCRQCQLGFFKAERGNGVDACQECGVGTQSNVVRDKCEVCPAGSYKSADSKYKVCVQCPANHMDCRADGFTCAKGYFMNADRTACSPDVPTDQFPVTAQGDSSETSYSSISSDSLVSGKAREGLEWNQVWASPVTYIVIVVAILLVITVYIGATKCWSWYQLQEARYAEYRVKSSQKALIDRRPSRVVKTDINPDFSEYIQDSETL